MVRPCRVRTSAGSRPRVGRAPTRPQREGIRVMRLRTRLVALALSLLGLSGLAALAADPPAPEAKPLAVLFLGDKGLHRPPIATRRLAPILAGRGIDVTYTDKASDLNPETLGKYDALIDLRQHDRDHARTRRRRCSTTSPTAGGFVPLHCASFCFLNSPKYIALVGAQFQKHGTGDVRDEGRRPRPPDHQGPRAVPQLGRDLRPHQAQQEGPHVLADARRPGAARSPGPGSARRARAASSTPPGATTHRTWGHPGFHDLVERGIRWAREQGRTCSIRRPRVAKGLKPFEYEPAEVPLYTAGARWGTLASRSARCRSRSRPRSRMKHLVMPEGFEAEAVRRRAADRQADRDDLGRARPAVGRRDGRLPQRAAAEGQGPRPDLDLRGHRRRRQGRQGHRLRRQAEHPDEPLLRRRRRDRRAGPGHALPQGHRRRRQGRRAARCCSPAGARTTRTPGRATCATASTTGSTAIIGYAGFDGDGRRRAAQLPPGLLPLQARTARSSNSSAHEQQHLGRRHQRGGAALRLDRQRQPERLHADPEPLLRGGARLVAVACCANIADSQPLLPDHREGPPGRLARRVHRRRRARALHGPHLSAGVLEPHRVRRRADRAPGRHVQLSPRRHATSARTTPGTSWPATTSGPRRSWPRSARTGTCG